MAEINCFVKVLYISSMLSDLLGSVIIFHRHFQIYPSQLSL